MKREKRKSRYASERCAASGELASPGDTRFATFSPQSQHHIPKRYSSKVVSSEQ